jgi:D-glycero-alpha-D-manno-heptose 1-phosphate guanylyltransferase
MIEAIILAGGLGTRLRSVVKDVPKPMAIIGGKPFLGYLMESLAKKGVTRIILSVGYKADKIIEYFGNHYQGIEIVYSVEDSPLGTGGAIMLAMTLVAGDHVFVVNGDTYLDVELSDIELLWGVNKKPVIVGVSVIDASRFGLLRINNSGKMVDGFFEKSDKACGIINAGCYLLPKNLLNEFKKENSFSFEKDYLQLSTNISKFIFFESKGCFIDIGVPSDFIKAERILTNQDIL